MSKRNCARGEKSDSSFTNAWSQFCETPLDDEIRYRRNAAVQLGLGAPPLAAVFY